MIAIALGSNIGDRSHNLSLARNILSQRLKVDLYCSKELETEAIGFDGKPFINQIVAFEKPNDLTPFELLKICKEIERSMGREIIAPQFDRLGNRIYQDRIIDIDILFFDEINVNEANLTIPHPQVETRWYIKELLKDITK